MDILQGGPIYMPKVTRAAAREYDRIVSEEIPSRTFRNFPVTPLMERCGIKAGGK